jgi:hypothetical protein
MHSISEEATGFEDELGNIEAYLVVLTHHLRESAKLLTGMEPAGLCANCAWPLWRQGDGSLMHYEYTYKLGNQCRLPVLAEVRT